MTHSQQQTTAAMEDTLPTSTSGQANEFYERQVSIFLPRGPLAGFKTFQEGGAHVPYYL